MGEGDEAEVSHCSTSALLRLLYRVVSMNYMSAKPTSVRSILIRSYQQELSVNGISEEEYLRQLELIKNAILGM